MEGKDDIAHTDLRSSRASPTEKDQQQQRKCLPLFQLQEKKKPTYCFVIQHRWKEEEEGGEQMNKNNNNKERKS